MAGDLDDYIDYIARLYPGQFGPSINGLLNSPGTPAMGVPAQSGGAAPPMAPPINIPPGGGSSLPSVTPSTQPAGAAYPDTPTPIASSTSVGDADPNSNGGSSSGGLQALAKQIMAMAGQKGQGLPFPNAAQLSPFTGNAMRPLPLNLPKFGQGPTGG
jgi:hypothetical protein